MFNFDPAFQFQMTSAIASISTFAFFGSAATHTVERAGFPEEKYVAYISFTFEKSFIAPDATVGTVRVGDTTKMKALLNFLPQTSLSDGLRATVEWIRREKGGGGKE